jgi:YlmC/YmxH family sporulation protein
MRWSKLSRKELVNLTDGSKSGPFLKLDLLINLETGKVVNILLPGRGYISRREQEIPWTAVKKISTDLILYEEVGTVNE